ncbi:MAG: hypothetical protein D6712_10185 [Chloroflexi bacterium]|nr:MAG: hypothetical protein D6712_10185 [Chloroflexota bacterium]
MKQIRLWVILLVGLMLIAAGVQGQEEGEGRARFEPPSGQVLFIIGQDLGAIGGLADYSEGYTDAVSQVAGGVTTYTGITDLGGLKTIANWGSGDVSAQLIVDAPIYENSALAIGLWLGGENLAAIAEGQYDAQIDELGVWIAEQDRPVYVRIGYEFDGPWNAHEPELYVQVFQRIVDRFNTLGVPNYATVWQSATAGYTYENYDWLAWYPGDEYVDWFGLSYFEPEIDTLNAFLNLAREHSKPVMVAESTPRGYNTASMPADEVWEAWYAPFFTFIHDNLDVIKAVAYINVNWDEQPMWRNQGWGDTRVQNSEELLALWETEMSDTIWLHASPELFELLGYTPMESEETAQGAFYTGVYPNILAEWGLSEEEINARIDAVWQQLFYGDDENERVYYPVDGDMAYVLDVNNGDVRTEGLSYGMMIAVQLDKKEEFDRIWHWAKTYLYHEDGDYAGYFAWHARPDGLTLDDNPAPDGEIWFATALYFAAARWGNGEGILNYEAEAEQLLHDMLREREQRTWVTPMFDLEHHMVVFVPSFGSLSSFTDPSYHTPHYYELWARWADENNDFWSQAAQTSREFWKITAHPETGLMPNYAEFTGEPYPMNGYGEYFYADAWRNAMNVAMDYVWFAADDWAIEQSNRWLNFFAELGIGRYNSKFEIDGTPVAPQHRATGIIAMNATAALAATDPVKWEFVEEFWNTPIPTGQYRYYDGLLYMLALLQLSGNYQIYTPNS